MNSLIVAAIVGLVASPVTPPVVTHESQWVLPDGGTPSNVTWPQIDAKVFDFDSLQCGASVWIQVDDNRYDTDEQRAIVDSLDDDGLLHHGEDTKVYFTHRFEEYQAPACVALTEVVPIYPTVVQATGSCVDGVWSTVAASVTLPAVENGRWLEHGPGPVTLTPPAGEYTFGLTTAEGNFFLGQGGDYQENGVAYFTVTLAGLDPQDCTVPTPTDSTVPQPSTTDAPVSVQADAVLSTPSTGAASATSLAETGPAVLAPLVAGFGAVIFGTIVRVLGRRKAGA